MIGKNIHIIVLLGAISLSLMGIATQTPFQQLTQKLENGQVFYAHFTQRSTDSYTGNQSKRSGEIWIAKNGYKVISGQQIMAVNGQISMVYDKSKNRVIISKYVEKDDDFAPSKFLRGVDSTYSIASQKQKAGHYIIKLQSDDPFSVFKKVTITLGKRSVPQKIKVIDSADNKIKTTFTDGEFTAKKPDMFVLNYPDSVRVIDMRK